MDSQPDSTIYPEQSQRQYWPLLLALVLPFAIHSVYFGSGFYYDDSFHLEQCERISRGEIALTEYLFLAHGEHLIPMWKLMFYVCWTVFGASSTAFHVCVTFFHVAAVCALWALVRRYTSDLCGSLVAIVWAGTAVGGWDGPFLWIAASHLSVAVTFFLAAMFSLSHFRDSQHDFWAMAMGILWLTCLLTMGSLLVLTPVLLLQYWLFERQPGDDRRKLIPWTLAWLAPCVLVGLLHLIWVAPAMQKLDRPPMNILQGLQMLGGGYASSSWHLIFWKGNPVTLGRLAGGVLLIIVLVKSNRRCQKLALLFFCLSFCFSVLAYMARSGWNIDHVLMWGRYRYLPSLFWCVVVSIVLERFHALAFSKQKNIAQWTAATLLCVFLLSQYRIASEAAEIFRQIATEAQQASRQETNRQAATINIDRIQL